MAKGFRLNGMDVSEMEVPSDTVAHPAERVSINTSPSTFGANIGEAKQQASKSIGQLGDAIAQIGTELTQKDAADAQTALQTHLNAMGQEFQDNNKNLDAVTNLPAFRQSVKDAINEYGGGLGGAFGDYNKKASNLGQQAIDAASHHTAQQYVKAQDASYGALLSKSIETAVLNRNTPGTLDDNLQNITDTATQWLQKKGLPPEAIDESVRQYRGAAVGNVVGTYLDEGNHQAAQDTFDKYKDSLDLSHVQTITKALAANADKREAAVTAGQLFNAHRVTADGNGGYTTPAMNGAQQTSGSPFSSQTLDQYLDKTKQIENPGNNHAAVSPTGARGDFQFTRGTWAQYGHGDINNPLDNREAAGRLAIDNAQRLQTSLGRAPTQGEVYLAHQQGAAGAAALLAHPNENAVSALANHAGISLSDADRNIRVNGGNASMTAGEFAHKWTGRFGDAPISGGTTAIAGANGNPSGGHAPSGGGYAGGVATPAQFTPAGAPSGPIASQGYLPPPPVKHFDYDAMRQDAFARAQSGQLNVDQLHGVLGKISEIEKQDNFADDSSAAAFNDLIKNGEDPTKIIEAVDEDTRLRPETKKLLIRKALAQKKPGEDLGPRYNDVFNSIVDGSIDSHQQILQAIAKGDLTDKGGDLAMKRFEEKRKDVSGNAEGELKVEQAQKDRVKGDFITKPPGGKDEDDKLGNAAYSNFVRALEISRNSWKSTEGNNKKDIIKEFWDPDNVDRIAKAYRPTPQQRSNYELTQHMQAAHAAAEAARVSDIMNDPPAHVDKEKWSSVINQRPYRKDGAQFAPDQWAGVVRKLIEAPTEKNMRDFDAGTRPGMSEYLFGTLGIKPIRAPQPPPVISAPGANP